MPLLEKEKKQKLQIDIKQLEELPSLPVVVSEILTLLADPEVSQDRLKKLIETDQSLSSGVLKLANSGFFFVRQDILDVGQAINLIGLNHFRNLLLTITLINTFSIEISDSVFQPREFWKHSLAVGVSAKLIAQKVQSKIANECFIAGLIHDIGKVALLQVAQEAFLKVVHLAQEQRLSLIDAERQMLDLDHSVAGKWLLEKWLLPEVIQKVVWMHHHPLNIIQEDPFKTHILIIRLANLICNNLHLGFSGNGEISTLEESSYLTLSLSEEDIEKVMTLIPGEVEKMAPFLQLDLDENKLYQESLHRLYKDLRHLGSKLLKKQNELERINQLRTVLHNLNLELHPNVGVSGTMAYIAEKIVEGTKAKEAACYLVDSENKFIYGKFFTSQTKSQDIFIPFGAKENLPIREEPGDQEKDKKIEVPISPAVLPQEMPKIMVNNMLSAVKKVLEGIVNENTPELSSTQQEQLCIIPLILRAPQIGHILIHGTSAPSGNSSANSYAQDYRLTHQDLENLTDFSAAAGLALERALNYEKLSEQAERLAELNRRMEKVYREMIHTERLATVGHMAAGAAHEINNPLAAISGRAQMLRIAEEDEDKRAKLDIILNQCDRISKIISDLMGFAKPTEPKIEKVNLKQVLSSVLTVAPNRVNLKNINIEQEIQPTLSTIEADFKQMEQVFLNLIINSVQAMRNHGTIKISISNHPDREHVITKISDTGPGIPAKDLPNIFDPFFTTKKEGEGSGLGLAVVNSIVDNHSGKIEVESKEGTGTTFTLTFPKKLLPPEIEPAAASEETKMPVEIKAATEKKQILVIDDERFICDILVEALEMVGYEVEAAADALEGQKILEKNPLIDLILLDLRMPRRDGFEMLQDLKRKAIKTPVIVITGIIAPEEIQKARDYGAFEVIQKPFQIATILDLVKSALEA